MLGSSISVIVLWQSNQEPSCLDIIVGYGDLTTPSILVRCDRMLRNIELDAPSGGAGQKYSCVTFQCWREFGLYFGPLLMFLLTFYFFHEMITEHFWDVVSKISHADYFSLHRIFTGYSIWINVVFILHNGKTQMNKALEAVVCGYRPITLLVDIPYLNSHAYDSKSLFMCSEPLKVSLDAESSFWNPL